jgi:excisionase family DNA binding protein
MSADKFYSIKELALLLGCDESFIQRQIKSGALVASKLSTRRLTRIRQSDLDAFINARRVQTGKNNA